MAAKVAKENDMGSVGEGNRHALAQKNTKFLTTDKVLMLVDEFLGDFIDLSQSLSLCMTRPS